MNDKQIKTFKEKLNKMITANKSDLAISSESGARTQHSANLNGRVKALEVVLKIFSDVLDNG